MNGWPALLLRGLLPLALLLELAALATGQMSLSVTSGVLLGLFFAWHWRSLMPYPRNLGLVTLAVVGAWLGFGQPSWEAAARLASGAAYYGAFIGALGLMQCLVRRLPQLGEIHRLLLAGPRAALYPGYLLSCFAISSILAFGMLSLVCGSLQSYLEQRGIDGERRRNGMRGVMVSALRGYALVPLLAPTSVGVAILTRELPGLSWAMLLPFGALAAGILLLIGWRLENPRLEQLRQAPEDIVPASGNAGSFRGLLLASLLGIGGIIALATGTWLSATQAAMLLVPLAVSAFLLLRTRSPRQTYREIDDNLLGMRNEVFIFASSAVLGGAVAALVPVDRLLGDLAGSLWLPLLFGVLGMLAIMLVALLGVAPIISLSLCAGLLAQLAAQGVDPLGPAAALLGGFSLAMLLSPYGASALLLARYAELSPWRVAVSWNGRFVLHALLPLALLPLLA